MGTLSVSVAFWDYDRTLPIADGRVPILGCKANCTILPPAEAFRRAFDHAEFDICELSLSRHAQAVAACTNHYVGLPIFLSRAFRHCSLYVRKDIAIHAPRDLTGRRIGLNNYDDTAAVVVRGFLRDVYGLRSDDIVWVVGDMDSSQPRRPTPKLPVGLPVESLPAGQTLMGELAAQRLDGLIALTPPSCFFGKAPLVRRLFPNWREVEQQYFQSTSHFPIMHLVGVRTTLLESAPWLAGSIMTAFAEAKTLAIQNLDNLQASKATLPWVVADLHATQAVMGKDFWPYGLEANRTALAITLRHLWEDGLLARALSPDEVFGTLQT